MALGHTIEGARRAVRVWAAERRVEAARRLVREHPNMHSLHRYGQAKWDAYVARNGEPALGSAFYQTTRRWLV